MAKGSTKVSTVRYGYDQKRLDEAVYITSPWFSLDIARKTFGKEANDYFDQLPKEQQDAIKNYTSSGYWDMNEYLRSGKIESSSGYLLEKTKKEVKDMQDALNNHSLGKDVWLQRGTGNAEIKSLANSIGKETLEVGDMFVYKQFVSTGTAKGAGFTGNVIMHIFAPKTAKGLYVANGISNHTGENETVLGAGQRFEVKKRYKTADNVLHLDLHIIS